MRKVEFLQGPVLTNEVLDDICYLIPTKSVPREIELLEAFILFSSSVQELLQTFKTHGT